MIQSRCCRRSCRRKYIIVVVATTAIVVVVIYIKWSRRKRFDFEVETVLDRLELLEEVEKVFESVGVGYRTIDLNIDEPFEGLFELWNLAKESVDPSFLRASQVSFSFRVSDLIKLLL